MLIAVWGRDGIGKSTLCDALGELYAQQGITLVIDTDLTQPTLTSRVGRACLDGNTSLGIAISGIGISDVGRFWHQHPKHTSLFYAGLTSGDDYMTYEVGLETCEPASNFLDECLEAADTVILDLSGQRYDPFLPAGLINADKVLPSFMPDMEGICWYNSIKHLLEMPTQECVLPVALPVLQPCNLDLVEKITGAKFASLIPYSQELRRMRDTLTSPLSGTMPSAVKYAREVRELHRLLRKGLKE